MSAAIHALHFLEPQWLWLLAGLPPLLWLALRGLDGRARLVRLVDPELLPHLLHGRPRSRRLPAALLATGWVLASVAMAGPSWSRQPQPLYAARAAQVLAISLSQRMLARDVAPDRIARARYKAHDLLAANRDGLNGLVAYAGEAFAVAPLTSDANSLSDLLDALAPDTMPVDGNNAAAAIAQGAAMIRNAKAGGGSLVLLTDSAGPAARAAAAKARAEGVRVSVLGIGTPGGAALPDGTGVPTGAASAPRVRRDDAALAAVAAAGGGRYVPMSGDHADVAALHAGLVTGARTATGESDSAWLDRGPWLLLPLLPLLALAFRRGWLLLAVLVALPCVPAPARAGDWQDLWLRRDQQAMRALAAGQAKQAERLARDPALRGAAAYRAGDYDAAIAALRPLDGADAQYNLGNALARRGQYRQAIAAYDRALARDPAHADARANRKAVEDWLRRQRPPQPPPQRPGQAGEGTGQQAGTGKRSAPPQNGPSKRPPDQPGGQDHGQDRNGKAGDEAGQQPTPAQQRERSEQARRALADQLDRSLGKGRRRPGQAEHQLGGSDPDDPQSRLPAPLRQALQRVPDDPGALLRRKFELEYRRRHGGAGLEDGL